MPKPKHRFILANYAQTAKYPNRTHEKGYWSNPDNIQWDEHVEFTFGLKSRDEQRFAIILDLDGQTVVKNRMSQSDDFDALFDYFYKSYETQIKDYIRKTQKFMPVD